MGMSRRDLLTASALVLTRPGAAISAADVARTPTASAPRTIVLCWNENPYGPGPAARAMLSSTIAQSCRYPDSDIEQFVAALAEHEGTSPDRIVTGTGSGELLCALGLLHGHDGGEIIAAQPTYEELANYARRSGATLKFVPVDERLRHDLAAMRAAVSERTRAIYICNPNNPTGTAIGATAIRAFVESLPEHVTTIVDEAYMDFAVGADLHSVAGLIGGGRPLVVLRTFSKIHGMAGVRCGYAMARPDIATDLANARMSSPSLLALRAARASLADHAFLADCRRRILASRARITSELVRLGLKYAEPQGNFVFFDTGMTVTRFAEHMRTRNILVGRRFAPYDSWCRITIGTEPEVEIFLQALRAVIAADRGAVAPA